jgi:hypothetical protein
MAFHSFGTQTKAAQPYLINEDSSDEKETNT